MELQEKEKERYLKQIRIAFLKEPQCKMYLLVLDLIKLLRF